MTKTIPLTQGFVAIVDDNDYDRLISTKWHAVRDYRKSSVVRAERNRKRGKQEGSMARVIMNAPRGFVVDHINGNALDNRKSNLRICTNPQNVRNMKSNISNTSGYRGVTWSKEFKKWVARIRSDGKLIYLGKFTTAVEAAVAYDNKAMELWGEFYSNPNIPKG